MLLHSDAELLGCAGLAQKDGAARQGSAHGHLLLTQRTWGEALGGLP